MTEWIWLDERTALAIHERSLMLHGGAERVRGAGLLKSALARPRQVAAHGDSPDVIDLAVAYTAGIIKNHPFIDGNKCIGFVMASCSSNS